MKRPYLRPTVTRLSADDPRVRAMQTIGVVRELDDKRLTDAMRARLGCAHVDWIAGDRANACPHPAAVSVQPRMGVFVYYCAAHRDEAKEHL